MTILKKLLLEKKKKGEPISAKVFSVHDSSWENEDKSDFKILVHNNDSQETAKSLLGNENANEKIKNHLSAAAEKINTVVSVCATDPFLNVEGWVEELYQMGVSGVQNFPSVGVFDGALRKNLESTGIKFSKEKDVFKAANTKGMFSIAVVFSEEDISEMLNSNCDAMVFHPGFFQENSEFNSPHHVSDLFSKIKSKKPDMILLKYSSSNSTSVNATVEQGFDGFVQPV